MKKLLIALWLIPLPIIAFGADFSLSAGGGGLAGYTFTRYTLDGGSMTSTQNMDRINYAGFLFFDAAYAELTVMLQGGNNSYEENMLFSDASLPDSKGRGSEASLGFSLMGKYPFAISEKMLWFPMIGVEYQIALVQKRQPEGDLLYNRSEGHLVEDRDKGNKPYPLSAWNSLWVNLGAGLDYYFAGPLFLRSELLFGFRLPTPYENGALEVVKNPPMNVKDPKLAGLTGSPAMKIGIGYCF